MRRPSILSVIAAGLVAATTAPALAQETVRIGIQQEPTALDPTADATAAIDGMISQNVLESLTTVDEAGTVMPQLAESWDVSEDGLTYTFHLREDVTFHDGSAFDAEDVAFTLERAMAEDSVNPSTSIFEPIESVSVIDPQTVEITLNREDAFFLFNMAQGDASIVSQESVDSLATAPVGTGPYLFEDWTRGDRLVLTRNEDWRNAESVEIERVEFRFISDAAAGAAALLAEELDAFPGFGAPELLAQFEGDPRFEVSVGSTQGEVILALNHSREMFQNPSVREAINHAIDREAIIEGAMYGMAEPIGSFFPPNAQNYVDLTDRWPHDTEQANALFEEAGIAGETLSLRVPPYPYATRSAEIIQAQMAEAGVEVEVETVEWGFWIDEVYGNLNYDMTIIAHTSPNDLGNFSRGEDYFYGYQNDTFDALWADIETEIDPERRMALEEEAQRFLADNAVMGFLFQLPRLSVTRAGLEGFWENAPVLFQPLADLRWTDAS